MPLLIRPATPADGPSLSRICLLTGSAGSSAESLHAYGELPGLVYALPYVNVLEWTWGFVLVDTGDKTGQGTDAEGGEGERKEKRKGEGEGNGERERVLGYILGASDTRMFERTAEQTWYPPLRALYPLEPSPSTTSRERKEADTRYVKLLHAPESAPEACVEFSPAHMHIDLLPEVQRRGWGKRLVDVAVRCMRGLAYDADGNVRAAVAKSGNARAEGEEGGRKLEGVWLGLDPKNAGARAFYERLGFVGIEGAPENCMGLKFENWKA